MMRAYRVVPPPRLLLAMMLVLYAIFEGGALEWLMGQRLQLDSVRPGVIVLWSCSFLYGVQRVLWFHPLFNRNYAQWLEHSPWPGGRRLPLGPVHFVWQDVFDLAPIIALSIFQKELDHWTLPPCLILGYLMPLCCVFFASRALPFGYLTAFGMGGIVRLLPYSWAGTACALACYGIAYAGLAFSLRRPLIAVVEFNPDVRAARVDHSGLPRTNLRGLGWPFDQLGPKWLGMNELSTLHAFLLSLLLGWWFHVFLARLRNPIDLEGIATGVYAILAIGLVATRQALYCAGFMPPISVLGRLATWRWIIPGYDKVFVGPAVALFGGCYFLWRFREQNADPLWSAPVTLAFTYFIGLAAPPTLKNWRLTGNHRIVPQPASMTTPKGHPAVGQLS